MCVGLFYSQLYQVIENASEVNIVECFAYIFLNIVYEYGSNMEYLLYFEWKFVFGVGKVYNLFWIWLTNFYNSIYWKDFLFHFTRLAPWLLINMTIYQDPISGLLILCFK